MNFTVIDKMLQAFKTEVSHLGQDVNPVDKNKSSACCQMLPLLSAVTYSEVSLRGWCEYVT